MTEPMAKKDNKENYSISVDPSTMKALGRIADKYYFGNRSLAAEIAIIEFVFKTSASDPELRNLLYTGLNINKN